MQLRNQSRADGKDSSPNVLAETLARLLARGEAPPSDRSNSTEQSSPESTSVLPSGQCYPKLNLGHQKLTLASKPSVRVMRSVQRVSPDLWAKEARSAVENLVSGRSPWPFYLWSESTGTGKTSVGLALIDFANNDMKRDESFSDPDAQDAMLGFIDYVKFPKLLKRIDSGRIEWRSGPDSAVVTRGSFMRRLQRLPLIVIDDLCEVPRTSRSFGEDHEMELKAILDARGRKPTMATSNLGPWATDAEPTSALTRIVDAGSATDRISDRLTCGTVLEMPGFSRRRG